VTGAQGGLNTSADSASAALGSARPIQPGQAGDQSDQTHSQSPVSAKPSPSPSPVRGSLLILVGIVLIALNLRLAVSATGTLLTSLGSALHLGAASTSFLTTVWTLAFAVGGLAGSTLARRFGLDRVLTASMIAIILGSALRGIPAQPALMIGSVVTGLGIALSNVLLPAVTREYFPHRIGMVTGLYGSALSGGAALSALVAVPIANMLGSPERGLAFWALPGIVALLVWLAAHGRRAAHAQDRRERAAAAMTPAALPPRNPLRTLARSRIAWATAALFGLQSAAAYVIMGYLPSVLEASGRSPAESGVMLSAVFFLGLPVSFLVPVLAGRTRDQRLLVSVLTAATIAAFLGLAAAPGSLAWIWVVLAAIGMNTFQLVLALIGLRGTTAAGAAALSTFSQSIGYLGAAAAPFGAGMLHDAAGSWTAPMFAMAGVAVCQGMVGLYVASGRRGTLELEG
jgi:CP family cyanate transporter-like MFS transporter